MSQDESKNEVTSHVSFELQRMAPGFQTSSHN